MQTGDSIEAKVFKAHAVDQVLSANLIKASKLLGNSKKMENNVKNLGKESRRGLTDGLREFIKDGNERALDVGALHRGTGTFKVREPKAPEGGSDVIVRKSQDELTLRAEEVNTSKALINVSQIEPERWSPPLVDSDWCAFCQALYTGIEGEDWEEVYDSVGHEGSQRQEGSFFLTQLAKTTFLRRNKTRLEL